ncbi:4'-phosphopantetheinyl transferase superfamily protein [Janibacter cremeus]|uniref:holo-ACP synthase n=1 Tax=Janibacter cremeus TaxID=1285192 RepID=UPI0023F77D85|nr:4'-phosphopantetheinyl transferase superfamily protein [Janibacter cremeus]WEV76946.1 4'-phosphopantetheinyl transferase superfamily protein [Janibacter cremeus]
MPIVGVGTDVVDVHRIARLVDRDGHRFLSRWFRPTEVGPPSPVRVPAHHIAALLAAKEATFKSLRVSGSGPVPWHDIEIIHHPGHRGATVRLHASLHGLAAAAGISGFHVSMSHTSDYATASVLAVAGEGHDSV